MSSDPDSDEALDPAQEVVKLVRKIQLLSAEEAVLRKHNARLRVVIDEKAAANGELDKLLRSMDCDRPGNTGWSARFGWLLGEVVERTMQVTMPRCDACGKWYDEHPTGVCRIFVPYDIDKQKAFEDAKLAEVVERRRIAAEAEEE